MKVRKPQRSLQIVECLDQLGKVQTFRYFEAGFLSLPTLDEVRQLNERTLSAVRAACIARRHIGRSQENRSRQKAFARCRVQRGHAQSRRQGIAAAIEPQGTVTSLWVANTSAIWAPGLPAGLAVLAIVHPVFFLHITTGPDSTNNVLALAFGVLIVFLVIAGSLVIMANLNENST